MIHVLQPTGQKQVLEYHEKIIGLQSARAFVKPTTEEFPKVIWVLFITLLADNHGSSFNHRVFARALLHQMATRFNIAYATFTEGLIHSIKHLYHHAQWSGIVKLIMEIHEEDIKEPQVARPKLQVHDFRREWIVESIVRGRVHSTIEEAGFFELNDFLKFYFEKDPKGFVSFMRKGAESPAFLEGASKSFSLPTFRDFIKAVGGDGNNRWTKTFESIDQLDVLSVVGLSTHQQALRQLILQWMLGTSGTSARSLEQECITLANRYGLDFNAFIKSASWVAMNSGNIAFEGVMRMISDKYQIAIDDQKTTSTAQKEEALDVSDHLDDLLDIVFFGFKGMVDRRRLTSFGFRTVDEALTYLVKQHPVRLKARLSHLQQERQALMGIGREIPMSSFYTLLSMLDSTYGRLLIRLLRTLELELDESSPAISRFLSAFRSLTFINLCRGRFNPDTFLDELTSLILGTSPNVYVKIIPILSSRISSISLPATGNAQDAISLIEAQLNDPESRVATIEKRILKKMIADEFFGRQLDKETSIIPYFEESANVVYDEIYIENAGLVIIAPYITTLLERCELTGEGAFLSANHQERAVLLLQYLMMDTPPLDEHHLPLNKILCGLEVDKPIRTDITLSKRDYKLIHGLIEAVISHWSIIGSSSIEGFRGSWLWRKGKLEHKEDSWELRVEPNSYDMLLDQLPFSISPLKYSWMKKPINVNWR